MTIVTALLLQAFVVFGDAEEAQKACLKDREIFCEGDKFGDRYVRVYPTVESDLPDIQECLAAASSHGSEVGTATTKTKHCSSLASLLASSVLLNPYFLHSLSNDPAL